MRTRSSIDSTGVFTAAAAAKEATSTATEGATGACLVGLGGGT